MTPWWTIGSTDRMRLARKALVLLGSLPALLLVLPSSVHGQRPDTARADTVFRIEGIRVEARRPVARVGGASAIEVNLDSLRLSASPTLESALRELPTVHVRTNSRGQAEISVRGSESRQVSVLLDGVPLTLTWDARTDVSVLPAGAVRDLSLVRGLSTLLHGPNSLGGVVELAVARGAVPAASSSRFSAGVDQEGSYAADADVSVPFSTDAGRWMIRAGAGYEDSPGFPLPDGVSQPGPGGDDRRLNTDVENVDGFAAVRYAAPSGSWASLTMVGHRAERGIAAELGAQNPRIWRYPEISRGIVSLAGGTGERTTPLGWGSVEATLGYDAGRTEILSFESRAFDTVDGTEIGDARTLTLRLLGEHSLGERGSLASSLTFAEIDHEETVDGERRDFRQELLSLAGETEWRLVDDPARTVGRLVFSVGGAYDRAIHPETGGVEGLGTVEDWGARAGLSALVDDGSTLVHLGVSRRGRFPSLREAFSEALDRFVANPDLGPEKLVAMEAGVTTSLGEGELQLVAFHHDLTDAIRRVTLSDGRRQRVNSDELESTGIELLLSRTFGPVELGGDLTLQSVELTDPGTAISSEPENVPEQKGSVYTAFPVTGGLRARLEGEYTGTQFCQDPDTGADVELDDGVWYNAGLSKRWGTGGALGGRRIETSIDGVNLADTALFDQCGLPRQGRLVRFQVRVF